MSAEHTSVPNHKLHKKLMRRRAIRESWPLLVWFGVAALAVWAYRTGGEFHRMRGVVSKPVETISAPFTGRLVKVPTDNPDLVIPKNEDGSTKELKQGVFVEGDRVVAMLATKELELEIKAEEQNAKLSRAKVQSDLGRQILEFKAMIPKLQNDEKRLEDELAAKVAALEKLRKGSGLSITPGEIGVFEGEVNTLRGDLSAARRATEQTQGLVDAALLNINDLKQEMQMDISENAKINLLKERIRQSTVSTLNSGYVEKVYAQPGSMVKAGDPIMDIVVKAPKSITALIPEASALLVEQGDTVYISIPNNRKQYVEATVMTLQQSLSQIPDYSSPIRGRVIRGRVVELGNLGGNDEDSQLPLLPGSEVIISLEPPGRIPFLSWFNQ